MRKELLVILLILFGGVLIAYRWAGESPLTMFSARGVAKVADGNSIAPSEVVNVPALKRKPQIASRAREQTAHETAKAQSAPSLPSAPSDSSVQKTLENACCEQRPFPFPTPENLSRGATKAEIRASYGAPNMDVAGTRDGHVLENYYYLNAEKNRLTIVHLQNGVLASAEALSSPYFNLQSPELAQGTGPKTKQ